MDKKAKKILLCDDSVFMRTVLKNILENDGYGNFVEAENGVRALELISTEKPDLILMDLIMPEKGGVEVIKEIGKMYKVIVVSAVGQDTVIKEAMDNGAIGYVIKPFDNKQVLEAVEKAFA